MRATPETNKIVAAYHDRRESVGGIIGHAASLERERDEARETIRQLKAALDKAMDENLAMRDLAKAARNFRDVSGRFNTQIAADRLMAALFAFEEAESEAR